MGNTKAKIFYRARFIITFINKKVQNKEIDLISILYGLDSLYKAKRNSIRCVQEYLREEEKSEKEDREEIKKQKDDQIDNKWLQNIENENELGQNNLSEMAEQGID